MKSVDQIQRQGKVKDVRASAAASGLPTEEIDSTVALIQGLIPLGLQAVGEALDAEVTALAGGPVPTDGWTPRRGPLGEANQAQSSSPIRSCPSRSLVSVIGSRTARSLWPRTNGCKSRGSRTVGLFRKLLVDLTCRQYAICAEAMPAAFGLSASNVYRCFVRASACHLWTLCDRRLGQDEFVAVVLDGKTFAQDAMVIALRPTLRGQKMAWASSRRPPKKGLTGDPAR